MSFISGVEQIRARAMAQYKASIAHQSNNAPQSTVQSTHAHKTATKQQPASSKHLTKENAAFVKKYGFQDLSNDQVRQYRDMARSIKHSTQAMNQADERFDLNKDIDSLLKKAGHNPKLRSNIKNLHRMLREHKGKFNALGVKKAITLMKKGPLDLASPRRRATMTSLSTHAHSYSPNLSSHDVNRILDASELCPTDGPQLDKAVESMTSFVNHSKRFYAARAASGLALVKMGEETVGHLRDRLNTDMDIHLQTIAAAKNPDASRKEEIKDLATVTKQEAGRLKKKVIVKYATDLTSSGMKPAYALSFAEKIYAAGGPGSRGGLTILMALSAAKRRGKPDPTWIRNTAEKMVRSTANFQPATWDQKGIHGLLAPSRKTESIHNSTLDDVSNFLAGGGQVMDTAATLLEVTGVGAGAATILTVGSFCTAVAGGILTLAQIGHVYTALEKNESNQWQVKAYKKALNLASRSDAPKNFHRVPYSDYSYDFMGIMTDAAKDAYRKKLQSVYESLVKFPPKQRDAIISGLEEAKDAMRR